MLNSYFKNTTRNFEFNYRVRQIYGNAHFDLVLEKKNKEN